MEVELEADPEATKSQVMLTLKLNTDRVKIRVEQTGQTFETPKKSKEFKIPLARSEAEQLTIHFERRGYKKATREIIPAADTTLELALEKRKSSGTTGTGKDDPIIISPIKPIKTKKKDDSLKLGRIKGF